MNRPAGEDAPATIDGASAEIRVGIDRLFRAEAPRLLRFFRTRVRDSDIADDMVQETFLRLAASPRAGALHNPAAFLQRIARNLLFDRMKRSEIRLAAMHMPFDEDLDGGVPPDQEDGLEAEDLRAQYERAIATLSPKTREVFLLHRLDGLTYKEIHRHLGVSLGTVEYHMMRALAQIDRALGEE